MQSIYGEQLKLTIFGESHAEAIGMTLEGFPAGMPVDTDKLLALMARRAPGKNAHSTARKEPDLPEFRSGILNGCTDGSAITAIIRNTNTRGGDYAATANLPRPGHADLTAHIKYGGKADMRGGGHFSGRLTAPLCIAGSLCMQYLEGLGVKIGAHISRCAGIDDEAFDPVAPAFIKVNEDFPVINADRGTKMQEAIAKAKADGDSVGGVIECAVTGLPVGLGGPMFAGMEGRIAQILYGIPAVKGVEFGSGFAGSDLLGSQNNDPITQQDGRYITITNNAGGILGGITNGMPLIFRAAFKPTPSIAKPQQTVDLSTGKPATLQIVGRHDPCIVPRAVPVVEAAAAIAICDVIFSQTNRR